MTEKKLTNREKFERLMSFEEVKADPISVEFITHQIELLNKKRSAERKPTANQIENEGFKGVILDGMEPEKKYTVTELIKAIPELGELSSQRVSAILRQMVGSTIERIEEKRKAYFVKM